MEEDLSNEDLVSAHIDRWIANQWLKAISYIYLADFHRHMRHIENFTDSFLYEFFSVK
jgi:hypothetical protein